MQCAIETMLVYHASVCGEAQKDYSSNCIGRSSRAGAAPTGSGVLEVLTSLPCLPVPT